MATFTSLNSKAPAPLAPEKLLEVFRSHPSVSTDTRECRAGDMFFALRGERFDGNRYALQAIREKGCAFAVVDDPTLSLEDQRCLYVSDCLSSLQELARLHRASLRRKTVIQVTGTNGKTTTKELLQAVLSALRPTQSTRGNLNNHIGVPLTLLALSDDDGFAVVETGASHPGEIAMLSRLAQPDWGLVTNVGKAHLAGFASLEGVIRAKGELYEYIRDHHREGVFLNASMPHLTEMAKGIPAVRYGLTGAQGVEVEGEVTALTPCVRFRFRKAGGEWHEVQTRLVGPYNIHNLLAAATVGLHFGETPQSVRQALEAYTPRNSRSELRETGRNRLFVDAYNANPSSMQEAIEGFLMLSSPRKLLILGDMLELGEESHEEHERIVSLIEGKAEVWLVGKAFREVARPGMQSFASAEEAMEAAKSAEGRTILIKGSNGIGLSRLADLL